MFVVIFLAGESCLVLQASNPPNIVRMKQSHCRDLNSLLTSITSLEPADGCTSMTIHWTSAIVYTEVDSIFYY